MQKIYSSIIKSMFFNEDNAEEDDYRESNTCLKCPWTNAIVQIVLLHLDRMGCVKYAFQTNMFSYGIPSSAIDKTFFCKLCIMG